MAHNRSQTRLKWPGVPRLALLARWRGPVGRALVVLAVACMIGSAAGFRPQIESLVHYRPTPGPKDYYEPFAPWLFGVGALAYLLALWLLRDRSFRAELARPQEQRQGGGWSWLWVLPGMLFLFAVSEANGGLAGVESLRAMSHHVQFALLLGGVLCVGVGLGGVVRPRVAWREFAFVLALAGLAVGLRTLDLGRAVRVMVDEGHFALGATYFRTFPDVKLLVPMPTSASFPFLFSYGQAGLVELLGRNLAGLRALSVLLGGLTIPALYLLARELYDRHTALLASVILLAFPPHIHYSRLALNNIADPLFGTLALALLARALRSGSRASYAWAGVALGLTQYFYEGGRIFYLALVAAWVGAGFILWRPRPSWRGVLLLAVAFVIVAAPVYYTLAGRDFPFFDRMDKTEFRGEYWDYEREANTLQTRWAHFRHSLLLYVNSPENTMFHYYLYYGGNHPLILEHVVPAFLLGLLVAAWQWRRPGVLPLIWLLGTSAGNALLVESAVTARYVVVFPALALLVALGIRGPLEWLVPRRWPDAVAQGIGMVFAVAVALLGAVYYFGPFLDTFNVEVREHVHYDVDDAMLRAADFSPGTRIYVLTDEAVLPEIDAQRLLSFLADDLEVFIYPPDVLVDDLPTLPRDGDLAFFVEPGDRATLRRLSEVYGIYPVQRSPFYVPGNKALLLFYVPHDS